MTYIYCTIEIHFSPVYNRLAEASNDKAQRQLTRTVACGSARTAGSTVRCSDLLAINTHRSLQGLGRPLIQALAHGLRLDQRFAMYLWRYANQELSRGRLFR